MRWIKRTIWTVIGIMEQIGLFIDWFIVLFALVIDAGFNTIFDKEER
jgi:hypothetical protein